MNIDYKHYLVYPYTLMMLQKKYEKTILDKYGEILAFLYQNGFDLDDNCIAEDDVVCQLSLFNNFKTYEDFEDLKKTTFINNEPTKVGYKIVDSVLETILKKTGWAFKEYMSVDTIGKIHYDTIQRMVNTVQLVVSSEDFEIKKVVSEVFADSEVGEIIEKCYTALSNMDVVKDVDDLCKEAAENIDDVKDLSYGALLTNYQKLYKIVWSAHNKIVKALGNSNQKGIMSRVENLNDEIYGSSGYYNPNNDEIKVSIGSAVNELKMLKDSAKSSDDIKYQMKVIASEYLQNGEKSKEDMLLVNFVKGDNSHLDEVRHMLANICFSGIMILLELKHNLSLDPNDSCNVEKEKKIMHELKAICEYTNYDCKEVA